MPEHTADATWSGSLMDGDGDVALGSGVWTGRYATPDVEDATDPEELLAAAQASCFAMTASYVLEESGYSPEHVSAESVVTLEQGEDGFSIPSIEVTVDGHVPDATGEEFAAIMSQAEAACPVSKALAGTDVDVSVR